MIEHSNDAVDSIDDGKRDKVVDSTFYDHPNALYRIAGSDRTYTYDELVEALEGDVTGLDFEAWAASYLQLRARILAAGAAGIITIVRTVADR